MTYSHSPTFHGRKCSKVRGAGATAFVEPAPVPSGCVRGFRVALGNGDLAGMRLPGSVFLPSCPPGGRAEKAGEAHVPAEKVCLSAPRVLARTRARSVYAREWPGLWSA